MIAPIQSLTQLRCLANKNHNYKLLALTAAENLGGNPCGDFDLAMQWLYTKARESGDEAGIVEEINFYRDLIQ